jgi:diguanylate cyclase (GGDEF)-like protein
MRGFLNKFLLYNVNFEDTDPVLKYKFIFLNTAFLISIVAGIFIGVVTWPRNFIVSMFDFGYSFIGIFLLLYLYHHKEKIEGITTIAIILALLISYINFLFDPHNPTRVILLFLIEAAVVYLKGRKQGAWSMAFIILAILLGHFFYYNDSSYTNVDIIIICTYFVIFYVIIDNFGLVHEEHKAALKYINSSLEKDILAQTQVLRVKNEELTALNKKNLVALNEIKLLQTEENLINKLNAMLQLCSTAEETYPRIYLIAQELFQGLSGGVSVYQSANQQLETVIQWGPDQILVPFFSPKDCFGVRSGSANIVDDYKTIFPSPHYTTPPQGGYMSIPMFVMHDLIAVVHVFAPVEQALSKHIQEIAIAFSNIVKIALTNINLRHSLQEMTLRDALTGLYNRRYLKEFLPRELNRITREESKLIVAILDIDDFKKVNDTFGHEAGDEVLKSIGKILNQTFRISDMACRFGGEEFLLVMFGSDLNSAIIKLENVRERIKNEKITFQGQELPKTLLSVGVASAPKDGIIDDILIDAADKALYEAKRSGKDRIEIYQSKLN